MSTELNNLQLCVDKLEAANNKLRTGPEFCRENTTMNTVIEAVAHLAEYCRVRVANHPALYPDQLDADMANLCARIEALESSAEALASLATENPANRLYGAVDGAVRPVRRSGAVEWRRQPPVGKPARDEWDHLLDTIGGDCNRHGWTDIDALMAWQMGRAAMLQARLYGARFAHDTEEAQP